MWAISIEIREGRHFNIFSCLKEGDMKVWSLPRKNLHRISLILFKEKLDQLVKGLP